MSRFPHSRVLVAAVSAGLLSLISTSPALAADEPQARDLDRITVLAEKAAVATKTDTELDEIPQSVSVVDAELARSRGADTLQDALRYTAGVTAEPYGLDPRADGFFVR